MEKNVKFAALASTAILGVTAVAPVLANADTTQNAGLNATASTNATVSFKQTANNSNPVGPIGSDGSDLGSNGSGVTNETGNLTIDYVTPNLNFGDHALDESHTEAGATSSNGNAIYNANYLDAGATAAKRSEHDGTKDAGTGDAGKTNQGGEFSDAWGGQVWMQFTKRQVSATDPATVNGVNNKDESGFAISAQMTNFTGFSGTATSQVLKGAQISFGNGSTHYVQADGNNNVTKDNDKSVALSNFTLAPNETSTLITTTKGASQAGQTVDGTDTATPAMGTHFATWAPSDVKLSVPQTTQNNLSTGDYHALIHWMIAPTQA